VAWWLWALGLAAAAARTTDPLLLALVVAVAGLVVAARRTQAPWGGAYRAFLLLGLGVVALRTVAAALLSPVGGRVLLDVPAVALPAVFAGVRLGGPVTVDGLVAGAVGGLRLAALLACVGAANALAHPLRLLRVVPGALYEVAVATVVAVTAAPNLLTAAADVRAARRLRGRAPRGLRSIAESAVPVLHGALERSLRLAASMDARGFGRRAPVSRRSRALTVGCGLGGSVAALGGLVLLLDASAPAAGSTLSAAAPGLTLIGAGVVASACGLVLGSRRTLRSRYRPDPWRGPEWLVAATGIAAAASLAVTAHSRWAASLDPSTVPLGAPGLPLLATAGILVAALPALLAPPPVESLAVRSSPAPAPAPATPEPATPSAGPPTRTAGSPSVRA